MREAHTDHPIHDLLKQRFSPYQFSLERPVADADLVCLFEAARWSASSFNAQPWRYIVAKRENQHEFERMLNCLMEGNRPWAKYAAVLALGVAQMHFDHNGKANGCALHDLGAASAQLTLEATARGLQVHQMAGILPDVISEQYAIPDGYQPLTAIAIGYCESNDELAESIRDRDNKPRQRHSLTEFVYASSWGETADLEPGSGV